MIQASVGWLQLVFFEGLCFEGLCDISVEIISRITVAFTLEKAFSNTSMNIYCVYIIVPFEHAVCSIAMSVYQRTHEQKTQKAHTHTNCFVNLLPLLPRGSTYLKIKYQCINVGKYTVDGRNAAPPGMYKTI